MSVRTSQPSRGSYLMPSLQHAGISDVVVGVAHILLTADIAGELRWGEA